MSEKVQCGCKFSNNVTLKREELCKSLEVPTWFWKVVHFFSVLYYGTCKPTTHSMLYGALKTHQGTCEPRKISPTLFQRALSKGQWHLLTFSFLEEPSSLLPFFTTLPQALHLGHKRFHGIHHYLIPMFAINFVL